MAHLSIGGIPEYLLKAGDHPDHLTLVGREFFSTYSCFYREPCFLLSQEFQEPKTYQAILNAIAIDNTSAGTIARFCGTGARHFYPYLKAMIQPGIIGKELPLSGIRRQGLYRIKDRTSGCAARAPAILSAKHLNCAVSANRTRARGAGAMGHPP